jgi:hypothetical protein
VSLIHFGSGEHLYLESKPFGWKIEVNTYIPQAKSMVRNTQRGLAATKKGAHGMELSRKKFS